MKKIIVFSLFFLCLLCLKATAQSKDEKAVAAAVEMFRKGIEDADRNALESVTADELVYGHSSGKVQDKAAFIEEIVSKNPIDYLTIDLTEQTIKIAGKTAVVRHTLSSATKNTTGEAGKVFIGNMLIFQKQHGKWKLLARQAYKK